MDRLPSSSSSSLSSSSSSSLASSSSTSSSDVKKRSRALFTPSLEDIARQEEKRIKKEEDKKKKAEALPPPLSAVISAGEADLLTSHGEVTEHKLYIGNLDPRVTEYHIISKFRPYGKIVRNQFLWHQDGPKKGQPRGFCFIEFSSREEAVTAKERVNGQELLGRPLKVDFVQEPTAHQPRRKKPTEEHRVITKQLTGTTEDKIKALKMKLQQLKE